MEIKVTIRRDSYLQKTINVVLVLLILAMTSYVSFVEGYRQGCTDTMSVVEERADQLVKVVEKRLFGE